MALAVLRLLTVPVLHRLPCLQAVPGCPRGGGTYWVFTYGKGGEESINFSAPFWEGRFFLVLSIFFFWKLGVRFNRQVLIMNGTLVVWDSRGSIK